VTHLIGQRIGDYRIIRFLGKGGFGHVYLGEHVRQRTQAAVKVLNMQLTNKEDIKQFINEASTFRLKHPNIVQLLTFGVSEEDIPFLVMDYAPQGSLRDRHPKGSILPLATIVSYTKEIAEALQYAHAEGIIHRDIKPHNMLLGASDHILLTDFGIAVAAHGTRSFKPQDGAGTPHYMAPEQSLGKPQVASDQYALGVVVYEWLCGTLPFHGSMLEISNQHIHTSPPSLCEKVPALSLEVEGIVMKALAKAPSQRWPTVQAFAQALEQVYQSQLSLASKLTQMLAPAGADPGSSLAVQLPIASTIQGLWAAGASPVRAVLDGKFKVERQMYGYSAWGEPVYELYQLEEPHSLYVMRELTISPHTSTKDQEALRECFYEGVERLRNLKHPSIPSLLFSFQAHGNYYQVMEYVPKRSLAAFLDEKNNNEEQVIQWMIQVCEVVSYLHSCSPPIILRMLEPDDIKVTQENSIRLVDITATLRRTSYPLPSQSRNRRRLDISPYESPEVFNELNSPNRWSRVRGRGRLIQIDGRSDVYSLGAIAYHLLTNHEPASIETPEPGSISAKNPLLYMVQAENRTVCPIEQVIIKAMQQDPAMRFQNVIAMRTALQYCLTAREP
jgi:serine/threonine protein kinase